MKYVILMYADPEKTKNMPPAERDTVLKKHEALRKELTETKELLGGAGLALPDETTTLAFKDSKPEVVSNQNATSTEQLTAYYEVDCNNQARAIEIAKQTIDSHVTRAEVRYIHT